MKKLILIPMLFLIFSFNCYAEEYDDYFIDDIDYVEDEIDAYSSAELREIGSGVAYTTTEVAEEVIEETGGIADTEVNDVEEILEEDSTEEETENLEVNSEDQDIDINNIEETEEMIEDEFIPTQEQSIIKDEPGEDDSSLAIASGSIGIGAIIIFIKKKISKK